MTDIDIAGLAANPDAYLLEPTTDEDPFAVDDDAPVPDLADESEAEPRQRAMTLVGIAETESELFRAPDGTPYARLQLGTHREVWPIKSSGFKEWLVRRYYDENGTVPKTQHLTEALNVINGHARFRGETRAVHLRIADHDGETYLDLANDAWEAVRITSNGWQVTTDPPVLFRRTKNTAPLPRPEGGGSLDLLRELINVPSEDSWRLMVAWIVFTLSPSGPYPVLLLHGEQGSAKSTAERVLRSLVDPNHSPLRAAPKEEQDLLVACHNCWIVALDNLSGIQDWLSDALCRVASGTGLAKRELYTDAEEVVLNATRPIALNGITELATRGDLLDRSILVDLAAIPEDRRLPEKTLWRRFEALHPLILGALLDAVSGALKNRATTTLTHLPRMADFAVFVTAAEEALGWPAGAFVAAYESNRRASNDISIDSSAVGPAIRSLVDAHGKWEGTAADLRRALEMFADEGLVKSRYWPKNAWALGNQLDRLAPNLRAVGIGIFRPDTRTSRGRLVYLWDIAVHGTNPPSDEASDAGAAAAPDPVRDEPAFWPVDEEED